MEKIVQVPVADTQLQAEFDQLSKQSEQLAKENAELLEQTSKSQQQAVDIKRLKQKIKALEQQLSEKPTQVEKIVEVEKVIEKPVEVQREASGDLREAARLLSASEFNKEDLSAEEIFRVLEKSSEDDVRKKLGFWAVPLPKDGDEPPVNSKYTGKPR